MAARSHLDELNPAQREAVTHGRAPLLVIAGAGTGKTRTLAHRVAQLVLDGADPARILLLTFSRRAAAEMTRRARSIVRTALDDAARSCAVTLPWSGTFHAMANRILRLYAARLGLDEQFTILDRGDAADLMNVARHDLGLSNKARRFVSKDTCLDIYSRCVNGQLELSQALGRHFDWCADWEAELARLFRAYVDLKQASHALDYDDLLLYWFHACQDPVIAAELGARFDHVLVDEYQDTNTLQAGILRALKPGGQGVTVVGDDAQAIYGFRCADVDNILSFEAQHAPDARVVALRQNYRSQPLILSLSNALMAASAPAFRKDLFSAKPPGQKPRYVQVADEDAQVDVVVRALLRNREGGQALRDQAVLFRNAHHSDALELELTRRDIPFVKYGGLKFLEAAHVKDLMALLRWVCNPRDRSAAFRSLMLLPAIGPGRAAGCWRHFETRGHRFATLADHAVPAGAAPSYNALCAWLAAVAQGELRWPALLDPLLEWYRPILETRFDAPGPRLADLTHLVNQAARRESCQAFLSDLCLDPPSATSDLAGPPHEDDDFLILSTVHSAKGQEWQSVFLLNVVDGTFPSEFACGEQQSIEEERRLLYVALTRAKAELTLIHPLRFFVTHQPRLGARHVYSAPSRFLTEDVLAHCVQEHAAPPERVAAAAKGSASVDLPARVRQLW